MLFKTAVVFEATIERIKGVCLWSNLHYSGDEVNFKNPMKFSVKLIFLLKNLMTILKLLY